MRPATPSARSRCAMKVVLPAPSVAMQFDAGVAQAGARRPGGGRRRRRPVGAPQQREASNRFPTIWAGWRWRSNRFPDLLIQLRRAGRASWGFADRRGDVDLSSAEPGLLAWLRNGFTAAWTTWRRMVSARAAGRSGARHGERDHRAHGLLPRATPETGGHSSWRAWRAVSSVYARGVTTTRCCARGCRSCRPHCGPSARSVTVFTDSAPVLEVELASRSGSGWRASTRCRCRARAARCSSWARSTRLAPAHRATGAHCGQCSGLHRRLPHGAIVAPPRLDARRCISYLTIEHHGAIDEALRPLIGNRIYGCDDCQLVCPWNKYAGRSALPDFDPREGLSGAQLTALMDWARRSSCAAPKAARSAASATSAGCATSVVSQRWATPGRCHLATRAAHRDATADAALARHAEHPQRAGARGMRGPGRWGVASTGRSLCFRRHERCELGATCCQIYSASGAGV